MHLGNVTVRVDADEATGLGHLRRCLTLARQLRREGFHVRLVSRSRGTSVIDRFAGDFPVHWLEDAGVRPALDSQGAEEWDALATLGVVGHATGVSWLILDSYTLGSKWEEMVGCAGHKVLAMDDLRDRVHYADVLVSDSGAPFDPALLGGKAGVRVLNGAEFALVDPEFEVDANCMERHEGPKRLLVCYGGNDPTNETPKALQALEIAGSDPALASLIGPIDVVLGLTNSRKSSVVRAARSIPRAMIHHDPGSLAPLMRSADIILCAGGNSMVEALAMRRPCLVTITSDNQELMVARLRMQGLIRLLGRSDKVTPNLIRDGVASVIGEYLAFCERLQRQSLVDLRGARRISQVICALSEGIA